MFHRRKNHKKAIIDAGTDKCFFIHEGPIVKNLNELRIALETMGEKQYEYHCNEEKNDFANWVKSVFEDDTLAKRLHKAKSANGASRAINAHLKKHYDVHLD